MNVAIIGQGYVGTELGRASYKAGHEVIGIDTDERKIESLHNVGYRTSTNFKEIADSEIVIITVPTPLDQQKNPDLSFIENACEMMKPYLKNDALIINESTSYPGTLRELISNRLGDSFLYASAPERVDPGNLRWSIQNTPRILGALNDLALLRAREFYKSLGCTLVEVSTPEVAEAAKLFENTFRQVNIALVNEFAQIAHGLGISTYETLEAANSKPYGLMKFLPSVGVGGHCIPVDPIYLGYKASTVGVNANFINLANKVNSNMPHYLAARLDKDFKIEGKRIQIAGISYKPNVSDIRESPSIALMDILRSMGAEVTWHDNFVKILNGETTEELMPVDLGIICVAHTGVDYQSWLNSKTLVVDLSTEPNLGFKKYI